MNYNRSEIMKEAWQIVRMTNGFRSLSYALRQAWRNAKIDAARAEMSEAGRIRHALYMLENKSRWTQKDNAAANRLYAQLGKAA